jgi:hypothetical protein
MRYVPNIAALLKSKITRISRKQVREETQPLKKAIAPYRSEIAALKRRAQALGRQIKVWRAVCSDPASILADAST